MEIYWDNFVTKNFKKLDKHSIYVDTWLFLNIKKYFYLLFFYIKQSLNTQTKIYFLYFLNLTSYSFMNNVRSENKFF